MSGAAPDPFAKIRAATDAHRAQHHCNAYPYDNGPLLAALAIEHGCVFVTYDRDYARFPGLDWRAPDARAPFSPP